MEYLNITDLIIAGIVLVSVIVGYQCGFIKTVLGLFSSLFSIILTYLLYPVLLKTPLYDSLSLWALNATQSLLKNSFLSEQASQVALNIIFILVLFFVIKFVIKILIGMIDIIAKIPVIKQINKLGGAAGGFLSGVLIVYFVLGVLFIAKDSLNEPAKQAYQAIDQSVIGKNVYDNNFILNALHINQKDAEE